MKMTLKNKYTMKIKRIYKEAEKLGYIPNTIEVNEQELRDVITELCLFKAYDKYSIVYKDRRREEDNTSEGITSSMTSACLQHRPNEISDMIIAGTAKLVYRNDIDFIIVKDAAPEVLMESEEK